LQKVPEIAAGIALRTGALLGTLMVTYDYSPQGTEEDSMNGLIYLVGLVVVILAVLSFFGLR
jgi:hypothetical protein